MLHAAWVADGGHHALLQMAVHVPAEGSGERGQDRRKQMVGDDQRAGHGQQREGRVSSRGVQPTAHSGRHGADEDPGIDGDAERQRRAGEHPQRKQHRFRVAYPGQHLEHGARAGEGGGSGPEKGQAQTHLSASVCGTRRRPLDAHHPQGVSERYHLQASGAGQALEAGQHRRAAVHFDGRSGMNRILGCSCQKRRVSGRLQVSECQVSRSTISQRGAPQVDSFHPRTPPAFPRRGYDRRDAAPDWQAIPTAPACYGAIDREHTEHLIY